MKQIQYEFSRIRLAEYHLQLAGSLEHDLQADYAAYSSRLNNKLMQRLGITDWRAAYTVALQYHQERFDALAPGGFASYRAVFNAHEHEITQFVEDTTNLGGEPEVQL